MRPLIVYWWNKKHQKKWQHCKTEKAAQNLRDSLNKQGLARVWIAQDVNIDFI